MRVELEKEVVSVGDGPKRDDILLDITVVPCDKGTLVSLRSDVLESYVNTSISASRVDFLSPSFSPDEGKKLMLNWGNKLDEGLAPSGWPPYIAPPHPRQVYTEVGNGMYNPLPFLLAGLSEGREIILGPTARAMREGYVAALLHFAEELFRTHGDKRGVKGTLRVVKDV